MKTKLIKASCLLIIPLVLVILLAADKPQTDIVSWFLADINHDSREELLVIIKRDPKEHLTLETGEAYGHYLKIYSAYDLINNQPDIKQYEPDYVFDLSELKPFKVQAGDINGDGETEIAVRVFKTAEFHPVPAKRPFFYALKDGELEPVWLGSRLSRPFVDYVLADLDGDGIDEIVSIEFLENDNKVIAVYDWKGFGFEVKALSEELGKTVTFHEEANRRPSRILINQEGEINQLMLDNHTGRVELSIYGGEE